jgi:hypothetical protein
MKLKFSLEGLPVPVSSKLVKMLNAEVVKKEKSDSASAITFNFRNSQYSPTQGVYHPVEIRVEQHQNLWHISYITDFSYVGNVFPELEKEIDFDLRNNRAYIMYLGVVPMPDSEIASFYSVWEQNFMSYWEMGCFDQIEISVEH